MQQELSNENFIVLYLLTSRSRWLLTGIVSRLLVGVPTTENKLMLQVIWVILYGEK